MMGAETVDESKARAVLWLDEYRDTSRFAWEQQTITTVMCEPSPGVPCYVMAVSVATYGRGCRRH